LIDNRRWPGRISLAANGFWASDCFHGAVFKRGSEKSFVGWRPQLRRNPIHTLKPVAEAMQTFLLFLAISEPSPRALIIAGAISLGLLAVFLHHKFG
jgi:hypothetical protein